MGGGSLPTSLLLGSALSNYLYAKSSDTMARSAIKYARSRSRVSRRRGAATAKRAATRRYNKTTTMRKRRRRSVVATRRLQKQVANLSRSLKSDQARHTHRYCATGAVECPVRQVEVASAAGFNATRIETAIANLRYYNPALPGTLTTANASTGTYTRQVHFEKVHDSLTLRNNYTAPVTLRLYICEPKNDTSVDPLTFYNDGVADQAANAEAVDTSALIYPSDINNLTSNWRLKMKRNMVLQPGAQTTVTHTTKPFDYDPAIFDSHALQYQQKWQGFIWLIRIEGILAHDNAVGTEQLLATAKLDFRIVRTHVITYDAGVNLDDISIDDDSDAAFTNKGVWANKPAPFIQDQAASEMTYGQ